MFKSRVSTLLQEKGFETEQISLLLNDVHRRFEHQIPASGNTKGKYLEPTLASDPLSSRYDKPSRTRFLCLPYFQLRQLPTHSLSIVSEIHTTRTLLETQYPSTSAKRDLQQAVCHFDYTPKRHCFHVPQLWCLIIDNRFLITSGSLSKEETQSQVADITLQSAADMTSRYLHLSDESGRRWLLPLSSCQSWTEFIAHLTSQDARFAKNYVVIYNQSVQGPENWANLIAIARNKIVQLKIGTRDHWQDRRKKHSLRDWLEPSYESGSSASETRQPKLRFGVERNISTPIDTSAGSVPVVTGWKEATDGLTENISRQSVAPQDSDRTAARKPHASIQAGHFGDLTVMAVSRQAFHLFYWLSATPAPSQDNGALSEKPPLVSGAEQPHDNTTFGVNIKKLDTAMKELTALIERNLEPVSTDAARIPETRGLPVECMPRTLEEVETKLDKIRSSCTNTVNALEMPSKDTHKAIPERYSEHISDGQRPSALPKDGTDRDRIRRKRCQMIVRLAKQVYKFLLPLENPLIESPATAKFWGTVYWYLENPDAEGSDRILSYATRDDLKGHLQKIADTLQYGPPPQDIQIPNELRRLGDELIGIFLWGTSKKPRKSLSTRFQRVYVLLRAGQNKLLYLMAPQDLYTMEAVLPIGIASLLINKLVKDITSDAPDIVTTYYDYMLRL
ncbi:MAG: hypothetical protein Q9168_008199, partial [Polycauliona sp. 1 TL-2023]